MQWHDHFGYLAAGPYKIHRGVKYWSVSYEEDGEYVLVATHCESLSQAKAVAAHDAELRARS